MDAYGGQPSCERARYGGHFDRVIPILRPNLDILEDFSDLKVILSKSSISLRGRKSFHTIEIEIWPQDKEKI